MRIKVPTRSLHYNMVIAEDLFTTAGIVLYKKHTKLNNACINYIKQRGLEAVYVEHWSIDDQLLGDLLDAKPSLIAVLVSEEFAAFKKIYDLHVENTKTMLLNISNGIDVEIDSINESVSSVLDNLKIKNSIFSYLNLIKNKDDYTYQHSFNVALLSSIFAEWLGFDNRETSTLIAAALLHDTGKTLIEDKILNKKGKLTDEEFATIKSHTSLGYEVLKSRNIPESIKNVALMHHEKIDGMGYPNGLTEHQIDPHAKIIAICDIYDAMTSNRVYRSKICPFEVIKTFETSSYGKLDTNYVLVFLKNIAHMYLNSKIVLSDDEEAEIVFINNNNLSKPIVRTAGGNVIDLSAPSQKELYISAII